MKKSFQSLFEEEILKVTDGSEKFYLILSSKAPTQSFQQNKKLRAKFST